MSEFDVVTVCGSMRFYKSHMLDIAAELSRRGCIVLMPFVRFMPDEQVGNKTKEMLDRMHFAKIDMSDAIYVVDVDGYIGDSTQNEIEYAADNGKRIYYHSTETFRN